MPDGSSSAAPAVTPGPSAEKNRLITPGLRSDFLFTRLISNNRDHSRYFKLFRITRNAQTLTNTAERKASARAKCALMKTALMPARTDSTLLKLKRILAPIDFSPASKKALDYAFRLGELFNAEVTLLHVFEPLQAPDFPDIARAPSYGVKEFASAEKNLRDQIASTPMNGACQLKWKVRAGVAAHEIVEAAKELDVDLIVIATHGFTAWKHFCIGSTAERVARVAPCPVLVVREKEHEFI
jgi:universal stress protein A